MSAIELNPAQTTNTQVDPTRAPLLDWDVFVTPGLPIVTLDLPPGITQAYFQAMVECPTRTDHCRTQNLPNKKSCFRLGTSEVLEVGLSNANSRIGPGEGRFGN